MIVFDKTYEYNQDGRAGCSVADGTRQLIVETVTKSILLRTMEGQLLEVNNDLETVGEFAIRQVTALRSGFDGRVVVTVVGFTPNKPDSRTVVVKLNRVVDPAA